MDMKSYRSREDIDKGQQKEKEIIKKAEKYEGMSENQLVDELMRNVKSAKNSGNFNYNEMLNFANTMFPYLSEEQRTKLLDLLKIIGQ